jgi:hypothetical protein
MICEVRRSRIRVHNALRPSCGLLSRICRVRVLFPDIGDIPVIYDLAFERLTDHVQITDFPTTGQVLDHLAGLTTV